MKKLINLKFLVILATILFTSSCERDDFTGHSQLSPTSPSLSVSGIQQGGYSLVEGDQSFTFDVALSEVQIVDVKLNISQVNGDAIDGTDYTTEHSVTIPAGSTKASIPVTVLSDDLAEETETFTLQIGDNTTSNASMSPVTVDFEILNLTAGDLVVDMSWETDALSAVGLDLAPTEVVDMRFLLLNSDGDVVAAADGGSFETLMRFDTLDDGKYTLATDIFSTIDAGDFNDIITIDIDLEFNQLGKINHMVLSFPAVMTNEFPCESYVTYLADVTKAGEDYTIEENVSSGLSGTPGLPVGEYAGTDGHYILGGAKTVLAAAISIEDGDIIKGLNQAWMTGFWGEEIIAEGEVVLTINADATVVVESQYAFTTLYDGGEFPYSVSGSGYINLCTNTLVLDYTLDQDGFDVSGWAIANGYMDTSTFRAVVSPK